MKICMRTEFLIGMEFGFLYIFIIKYSIRYIMLKKTTKYCKVLKAKLILELEMAVSSVS